MSSRNYYLPLAVDVLADHTPSYASDKVQPDREQLLQYVQYQRWVPEYGRTNEALALHNKEIVERQDRAQRSNLCKWCAKIDLAALRSESKQLDWDFFEIADDPRAVAVKGYFGHPRKGRRLTITQGPSFGSPAYTPTVRPGCHLCRILRNICREMVPDKEEFNADLQLKEPMPMCLHDCGKSEKWSTVDILITIGSMKRTITLMPLLPPSETEASTQHTCMAKHGLSPATDFERISGWINQCDNGHHHELQDGCSLPFARFIDIKNRCLVEQSPICRFAALSYTWGDCQQFQLKKDRLAELKEPYAILTVWNDLSKVVIDSIAACERLNIPFLWIDTLCIVDDDPTEKHTQISNMDQIYSSAYITFIAAAGRDANAGLPRVTKQIARKTRKLSVDNFDYQLANVWDWDSSEVDKSAWSTRGWTFQELVLSRRVLAFTPTEVFFYCSRGFQAESMHQRSGSNYESRFGAATLRMCNSVKPQSPETVTYSIHSVRQNYETVHWNLLNNYLGRQLSYDMDILAAFSGVLNAEGSTIGPSFWGLPYNILARALFWDTNNDSIIQPGQHYFKSSEFSMTRRVDFPSWSWTGWKISKNDMFSSEKKRYMLRNLIDSQNFTPFVHIYHIDDTGAVTSLMGKRSEAEGVEGFDPWQVTRFNHQMRDFKCKPYSPLVPDATPHPNAFQHVPSHCLIFLASCSTFTVSSLPESRDQDHAYGLYKILTGDSERRGNANFPRVWLNIEWRERQNRRLEFVLLGMDVDEVTFGGKGYYAMLIEHREGGFAERVAIPQPFTMEQWGYGEVTTQWVKLG